ncbi:lactonase family protein [Catellatospora sp. TT07R-123]|uniref:lactonase family protein n=1 Tax=Catellatospora sp. TT07R-123 TaxID=2733863 RepID=UPI001BB32167|nr:lactonase family protein [Catellatospora sp. TT07R-123]
MATTGHDLVYIGAYTDDGVPGITGWHRDAATGELTAAPHGDAPAADASFLAWHPNGPWLYAASEFAGEVLTYAVAPDGALTHLGTRPTGGEPCHLSVDPSGRWVAVANYGGGSVALFEVAADGTLEPRDLVRHTGSGLDPERQEAPHAHLAQWLGSDLWVTDLGIDQVVRYTVVDGALHRAGAADFAAGMGPRWLAAHPDGAVFVAGELDATVVACTVADGVLRPGPAVPAALELPEEERTYPSHIECSADGRFVYLANRGPDCLTVFAVAGTRLTALADVPTGGRWPRHFAQVDDLIYVANQTGDSVTVLRVDPDTGIPVPTGAAVEVARPACVLLPRR